MARDVRASSRRVCAATRRSDVRRDVSPAAGSCWDEEAYKGDAYGVFSYAAAAVDLEIDKRTFEVRSCASRRRRTSAARCSRSSSRARSIGGSLQAVGWAHREASDATAFDAWTALTNVHHPDDARRAALRRDARRGPLPARPVRREGHRRAADGRAARRPCPRRSTRASACTPDCHLPATPERATRAAGTATRVREVAAP